jgi:UPF0271 protein
MSTNSETRIDLNSDLGENVPDRVVSDDAAMLGLVTSANVSCGFHAGNPEGIHATVDAAVKGGVVIGAHPGYDDYEGFGRRALDVPAATLQAQVEYQIGALIGLATAVGGEVAYVKPHGGLYNAIVRDEAQAKVVVDADHSHRRLPRLPRPRRQRGQPHRRRGRADRGSRGLRRPRPTTPTGPWSPGREPNAVLQ